MMCTKVRALSRSNKGWGPGDDGVAATKASKMFGGNPMMDYYPIHGGVKILLVVLCYGNQRYMPALSRLVVIWF